MWVSREQKRVNEFCRWVESLVDAGVTGEQATTAILEGVGLRLADGPVHPRALERATGFLRQCSINEEILGEDFARSRRPDDRQEGARRLIDAAIRSADQDAGWGDP
jgi:hypothetical protein